MFGALDPEDAFLFRLGSTTPLLRMTWYPCKQRRCALAACAAARIWHVARRLYLLRCRSILMCPFTVSLCLTFRYNSTLLPAFRVLQYSGDADPCVPYVGTERWIASLNYSVASPWRPWTVGPQGVAGYSTQYNVPGADHKFTFATVSFLDFLLGAAVCFCVHVDS